ncbi:MAG: glycosyltransferase family 39 protein [Thermoleophilia bacterium]|nr:glycosyltransferase family 39 protein [Thermoleophilia bacterium]
MAHGGHPARPGDDAGVPAASLRAVPDEPETGTSGQSRLRSHVHEWQPVYVAFALSRLLVFVVGWGAELAMRAFDVDPARWRPFAFAETYPHYADVATNGYTLDNAFNHPLLPALMAGGDAIGIPMWLTAFVVSNLAFLAGLVGIAILGERYVGRDASIRGATYLAFAPFAYWFSVTSTEGLLLVLVAGSALLALRATPASWLGAGALAALAVLCRPPGALVGVLLLCIAISQLSTGRLRARGVMAAVAAGAMIPAALLAFFAYLDRRTGDALASLHSQADFNRELTLDGPFRAIGSGLGNAAGGSIGQAVELVATFGAAALLVLFAARAAGDRWEIRGWTAFGAASLLLPLATGVLWQMPRFALLIPPVFWMLGRFGAHRRLHVAVLVLFPVALAVKVAAAVVGVEG